MKIISSLTITVLFLFHSSQSFGQADVAKGKQIQLNIADLKAHKNGICTPTESQLNACVLKAQIAMNGCLSTLSPHITKGVAAVGALTAVVGGVTSMSDSCSKAAEAMKIANMALTAYNAACTAAMMVCKSSCSALAKAATAAEADSTNVSPKGACAGAAADAAPVIKDCAEYKWNMLAAGAGLLAMVAQLGTSNKCEDDTKDCASGSNDPRCGPKKVDCTKEKNLTRIECICAVHPNTPGCPGAQGQNQGDRYTRLNPETVIKPDAAKVPEFSGSLGPASNKPEDTQGFGSTAAPPAAGGGGSGSGGADSSAAGKKETGRSLNPNMFAVDGGGGGGGRSASGGGYADLDANSQYKNYIPGGAKDPSRLSQQEYTSQVTGGGGKSNFDKVRERYRDNRSSLLDQ